MLTLLMLAVAAPTAPIRTPVTPCRPAITRTKDGTTVRVRPLSDMPDATQIQTVYRHLRGGCADLAVVAPDVGARRR